ncbi:MAG: beta-lactamase family protein [Deltaproteobacteria bacterium]|nr:beta-lactamase family protein [Deltaproteobacteria bacterium]
MQKWLAAALDYIPLWLEHQIRQTDQPGCVIAIAEQGRLLLEQAFGYADIAGQLPLTPRHRFRVASHSKSFTATGIMKLREQGRLRLDDRVGDHIKGFHRAINCATIAQLLSHAAGITRDGPDSGYWQGRRPFPNADRLRELLALPPVTEANTRFKYSNLGYGLLGLVTERLTGEPYCQWIKTAVIEPAGLLETDPDMPFAGNAELARGYGSRLPAGCRFRIAGDGAAHALAPATGFVSTAADLVRFFAQLDPAAKKSVLPRASRREMVHGSWRDPNLSTERYYGLGITSGVTAGNAWFGHHGAFQGFTTRTAVVPSFQLTISVLTNAVDGPASAWLDGIVHILATSAAHGVPSKSVRDWTGRWWSIWGAVDLVPMGRHVMIGAPALLTPFLDGSRISVSGHDRGRIDLAPGFASRGEPVKRVRSNRGDVDELWLGGNRLLPEAEFVAELKQYHKT